MVEVKEDKNLVSWRERRGYRGQGETTADDWQQRKKRFMLALDLQYMCVRGRSRR